jgi:SAM-dependent methyltransferase
MTTTTPDRPIDAEAAEAFAGRLVELCTGGLLTYLIDIGRRTGLFDAAATMGPATSAQLAAGAGLHERYVREWLGAMVTAGIVEYEPAGQRYWLPVEHAASLVGDGVQNLAPLAQLTTVLGHHVPAVADAFRAGGGVPYAAFLPDLHDVMDALWGPLYDRLLVPEIVPLAPGLPDRLRAGARAADVACGTGRALVNLATAYPASTFVGYDLDPGGLERGRALAAERGLTNLTFHTCDAAALAVEEPFDAVFIFNALHDQADPAAVLRRVRDGLRPGGVLLLDEPGMSARLEDNIGDPMAPFVYSVSTLHCLTVSLAQGGAGLGTVWGEQTARQLLADAGFADVTVHPAPGDPGNSVFVATRGR